MFVRYSSGVGGGPTGPAGGDLSGFYPNPTVVALEETSSPARLALAGIPDLTFLQRSGLTVIGIDPNTVVKGPWSNVLYVDGVRGNDTTAARGNDNLPFKTIQAAANAMVSGDIVVIAAQRFILTAAIRVPATVATFAFRGANSYPAAITTATSSAVLPGVTHLVFANGATSPCFDLGADLGHTRAHFDNIAMVGGSLATLPFTSILADGSLYAQNQFFASGLYITNCNLLLSAKYLGTLGVRMFGCLALGNTTHQIHSCGGAQFTQCGMQNTGLNCTYDAADPLAPTQQTILQVRDGSVIGGSITGTKIAVGGQVVVYVDETSGCGGITGSATLAPSVNGAKAFSISFCGYVGNIGGVDFASAGFELPDTATVLVVDFSGARFYKLTDNGGPSPTAVVGPASILFKIAGAAANAQTVKLDGCVGINTLTLIRANANVNLTARGASFTLATVLSTPDATGTILPPSPLKLAPVAVAAAPQPVTYPCRIPAGSTAVQVMYNTDNAGSVPTGVITVPTQTGFSAGLAAAGGGNLYASVMFPG